MGLKGVGRVALIAPAVLMAVPALAQNGGAPPASVDASLNAPPTVDRDRTDRTLPLAPGAAGPAASVPGSTVAVTAAPSQTLLTRVRYEGASLAAGRLDAASAPYIGKPITPENLQALATAVGKAYAASNIAYYAVMIPPQRPDGGVLVVRVTEGAVTQYTLNGVEHGKATPRLAEQIARIMHDRPLRKSTLDRALIAARELPGETLTAQMRQIGTSGDLILDVTAHRKVADVTITIDNNGVANVIQAVQAQVAVGVNNLLHDGDRFRVSAYLPFYPKRYQLYTASYSAPLNADGLTLTASGSHVYTRTEATNVVGKATLAGVTLSYPLIRSTRRNLVLTASLDGTDSSNYFLDTAFGNFDTRVARFGAAWSQADEKSGYAVSVVGSQGLAALGARAFVGYSDSSFTKVNAQAVVVRKLGRDVAVKATVRGQYSDNLLPVTEQAAIGGPGAGQAFLVGEITGDKALAGELEVNWTVPMKSPLFKGSQLFAFTDGALAGVLARPYYGLVARDYALSSAGAGLRLTVLGKWRANVQVAVPVVRPLPLDSRKARVFFGLGRAF